MPVLPGATLLTFTNSASASVSLWANEIGLTKLIEPFQRLEFSNGRRREVKNSLGGLPMITQNIANIPLQTSISCAGDVPRPLTPESTTTLANTNQQFNIQRYTIQGAPTPVANLAVVQAQAITHLGYLQQFQYHQTSVSSDISYADLATLALDGFSYLTTTGVSLAGDALGGTATQMLITNFSQDVAFSSKQADGTVVNLATYTLVIENRTITSQAP